jgi:RNA polymerase sigma-70 factor (ECF subfamily)
MQARRYDGVSDRALVKAYLRGDAGAFEELYLRYEAPLFGYVLGMVREREEAEDVLQETFLKIMRSLGRYREQGSFRSWLYTVASNLCRDHLRKRSRHEQLARERLQVGSSAPDPEAVFERSESSQLLSRLVDELPDEQREVVLLRVRSDLSFREIARLQGCPLGTALGRMHLAVKKLRRGFGLDRQ